MTEIYQRIICLLMPNGPTISLLQKHLSRRYYNGRHSQKSQHLELDNEAGFREKGYSMST